MPQQALQTARMTLGANDTHRNNIAMCHHENKTAPPQVSKIFYKISETTMTPPNVS